VTDPITAGGTVLITGTASGIDLAIAVATPPLGEHRRHPDRRHGSERGGRQPGSPSTFAPSTFDSANSPAGKALPRSPRRRPAHPPEASAVRTLRRPSSGRHGHVGKGPRLRLRGARRCALRADTEADQGVGTCPPRGGRDRAKSSHGLPDRGRQQTDRAGLPLERPECGYQLRPHIADHLGDAFWPGSPIPDIDTSYLIVQAATSAGAIIVLVLWLAAPSGWFAGYTEYGRQTAATFASLESPRWYLGPRRSVSWHWCTSDCRRPCTTCW